MKSLLKELSTNPKEILYRRQLVKLYVDQKRPSDAERELRHRAVNPTDHEAGLDVARYLKLEGGGPRPQELHSRVTQEAMSSTTRCPGRALLRRRQFHRCGPAVGEAASGAGPADQALLAQAELAEMHLRNKKVEPASTLVSNILSEGQPQRERLKLRASSHGAEQARRGHCGSAQALNDQPRSVELMSLLAIAYERGGSIELADKQFADSARASNFDARVGLDYVAFLDAAAAWPVPRTRGCAGLAPPSNIEVLSALAEVRLTVRTGSGRKRSPMPCVVSAKARHCDQVLGAALSGQRKR